MIFSKLVGKKKFAAIFITASAFMLAIWIFTYLWASNGAPYKAAESILIGNKVVEESIGKITEAKLAYWGFSVRQSGASGSAQFEIYITGEKSSGKASVSLELTSGNWKLKNGKLFVNGSPEGLPL